MTAFIRRRSNGLVWLLCGMLLAAGCTDTGVTRQPLHAIDWGLRDRTVHCDAHGCCQTCCRGTCPDDYCPREMPCVARGHATWGCDTYCAKPMPCPPPPRERAWCDDYCEKDWQPQPCRPLPGATCQRGYNSQ